MLPLLPAAILDLNLGIISTLEQEYILTSTPSPAINLIAWLTYVNVACGNISIHPGPNASTVPKQLGAINCDLWSCSYHQSVHLFHSWTITRPSNPIITNTHARIASYQNYHSLKIAPSSAI